MPRNIFRDPPDDDELMRPPQVRSTLPARDREWLDARRPRVATADPEALAELRAIHARLTAEPRPVVRRHRRPPPRYCL